MSVTHIASVTRIVKHGRIPGIAWVIGLSAVLAGCGGCVCVDSTTAKAYADATATEYRAYVENDPNLTQEQKDRRLRAIEAFVRLADQVEGKKKSGS